MRNDTLHEENSYTFDLFLTLHSRVFVSVDASDRGGAGNPQALGTSAFYSRQYFIQY